MKKLIATVSLLLAIPMFALAQNADHHYPWQGYFLLGIGTGSSASYGASHFVTEQMALGGEGISKTGLGLGFEMGWTHWSQHQPWMRTPSLDVSFHFPKAVHHRIEPFVQAGATLLYSQIGSGNRGSAAANFGGGINLWMTKHVALRWDVKDFTQGARPGFAYPNLLEFRMGLAFR
jgi:hypothetical protein